MSADEQFMLSHYRLVKKIGEGGMGVVWKAIDTKLDREVAIKVLPEALRRDPARLLRFEREAKVLAAVNHPNIVTIHSIEELGDRRFITMELVRGRTLADLVPDGGLPLKEFFDVAVPLGDAVAAAHEHRITHRDLKPRNIMVGDDGTVKVLDFGLAEPPAPRAGTEPSAHADELPTETLSRDSWIVGTVPYMSPEQLQGRPVDPRSDIFSLGIILYEMATGRRPFRGPTAADVIAAILKDSPRPIEVLRPDLPRHLDRTIRHCLEKDPARRFRAAADLRNELDALSREARPSQVVAVPSIAVLPFANMSPDKDQDYFCEGIADEIINALTKITDLRVISRTSSFQFKEQTLDSREIGDRLGVGNLLEGSVRKSGERLRVTAELINVADGSHVWSERYDRELKDVFAIQDEIAQSIVSALEVRLSPKERRAIKQVATADVRAYEYYLRGRKYYYQYRTRGIEFALQMFTRAIEIDPAYALAYAGLADCCSWLFMNADHDEANRIRADAASRKALELDPELAEAYAARGVALSLSERHDEAERIFETAIRLNPRLFEAYYFYARDSFTRKKFDKAIRLYEQASEVNPEDYQSPLLVGQIYADLGRHSEAEAARRRGIRAAEQRLDLNPDDVRALYMGANGLAAVGERERGVEWAKRALEIEPGEPMLLYNVACIYALADEKESALACLEQAIDRGFAHKKWLLLDSNLDSLRDLPRFEALVERMR